jgi:hypothetical protein
MMAVLLAASAAWGADAPKNLAPNPDFEQPNHVGWAFQDKAKASLDKDHPHGGVYSLRQDAVKGERWNCVSMSSNEIVKVEPGKDYYVSVWGRNNLVGGSASIIIREIDDELKTVKYVYTKVPANQPQWKQYQLVHKPSEKATGLQIYFYIDPSSESGSAWWDDVTMNAVDPGTAPIQPPATAPAATPAPAHAMQSPKAKKPVVEAIKTGNLAPNPGFELPNHQGWALQENVKASVDTDHPHEGQNSLRQEAVTGNRWNCVSMSSNDIVKVQPGAIYYVSLWGRNDLVGGSPSILIRELDDKNNTIRYEYHKLPANQAEWKQYDLTHRPSEKTVGLQIYLYVAPGAASGSAWWDDVSMTAVQDPFASSNSNALQIAPLATSTIVKGEKANAPDILSAWINAGRDAVGGHLTVQLSKAFSNGQADQKPIWSLDASKVEREGPRPVQVPVSNLAEGRYQLALNFTNADDTMRLQWDRPVAVIPPFNLPAPESITRSDIGPKGLLRVNGKPFLSVYFYHNLLDAPTLTMLHKDYGVTTAQVWGGASIDTLAKNVEMAYRAGLYSWVVLFHPATFDAKTKTWKTDQLIEAVNRLKSHPGVIGWDLSDEPDGTGVSVDEVRRAADLIRKTDPNHVVMVNLCRETTLAKFGGISDFASYDSYPFHARDLTVMHKWNQTIMATTPGKPLLSCLQTWGDIGRGMPTPAQLRAETYYCICDGMTMFHYYSWTEGDHAFGFLNNDSELASCVKVLDSEMFQLQPFFFQGTPVKATVTGAADLACLAKQVGDHVEIVVVNPTAKPVEQVRVALADHAIISAVSRFDNDRQPTITDGAITDRLPAYGVVVYQVKN